MQTIIKKYIEKEAKEYAAASVTPNDDVSIGQSNNGSKSFRLISAVSIDDDGNEVTLCAKDIILKPFVLSFDHIGDDHNLHMHH